MLAKYLEGINSRGVILASGSKGRATVCQILGLNFEIQVSGFPEDENWRNFPSPEAYALFNARNKAKQINSDKVVIAADTIVYLDGVVFEKPVDRQDCIRMMKTLSGRVHKLITGVVVKGVLEQEAFEVTELEVDELTDEVINAIADCPNEWADHSGGYSIDQKYGATIFKRINGSYHNIIGLPALSTAKLLLIEHEEYLKRQNNQN